MSDPLISIVMRSFNEAWALKETLPVLATQNWKNWELIVIDSGSTDGSHELIRSAKPAHFIQITPQEYTPGRVMNHGMRLASSERVIFLNADATPQNDHWLRPLAEALADTRAAACFGRQIPRPDCRAVFACDYDRCFGPARESAHWDHFFSMVSSGLRKEVWRQRGFREDLQYAEDDEYTRWCRSQGYAVPYVQDSVVMHSHNYTPQQSWKRSFGDARAIGKAWSQRPSIFNWPRTVALGWINDVWHDLRWCLKHGRLQEMIHAMHIRWQQRRARLAGFKRGWREQQEEQA
ncbi:MAG: glycosyl transferase family 2 [Chthoniobacter sp. 12-60-6]|nr:MAG: glycosyl transferase family 2 [Chthoniobacter sp. 12-60-6]